jgi:D-cysteine desulfhydrase
MSPMRSAVDAFPPRLEVARLPTPIAALRRLSALWGGSTIWVKRDDQTDAVLTGNKIRKLQYVVREALDAGCDTLVTCGGIQSNHCRATAALARQVGMQPVLVLRGEPPQVPAGNYFLDTLFGADVRWVDAQEYREHDRLMQQIADDLRAAGRHPFVIAEGCSMPTGCWGYIEAAREIAQTQRELSVRFDAIVHAVGSGGTSAGLELGLRLFDVRAQLFGVPVCDDASHFHETVAQLCRDTVDRFDLPVDVPDGELRFIDGYVGDGYGRSRPEERSTIVEVARTEGLLLDPVYSGKAMHALRHELDKGCLVGAKNILFVHTGGVFGLFPHASSFAA